jgi:hypothetical protein
MAQKFDFTDDALAALEAPAPGQQLRVFDAGCPGLGLWLGDAGQKVFFAYRWAKGEPKPTEAKVGPFPAWSVSQARDRARELVRELAAAAAPVDQDEARTPGECKKCLDMTMLNAEGLCNRCRPLPPCVAHPEVRSTARCRGCSRPHCDACLTGRSCAECAAKQPAKRAKGAPAPVVAPKGAGLAGLAANRKVLLGGLVGVLVLVQGGMFALQAMENAGPPATPEDHYVQRVGIAQGGIEAFRAEKRKLPKDAAELAAFLRAKGAEPPKLAGAAAPLPKDAVIYVREGDTYDLYATTGEGQRFADTKARPRAD